MDSPMRIAFFIESLQLAGAERVAWELARASGDKGCEAHVITVRDLQVSSRALLRDVEASSLFRKGEFHWPRSALAAARRLRRSLVRLQPDVLAIHTPKAAEVAALAGVKLPTLWVLHGHDVCWDGTTLRRRRSRSLQRWTRRRLKAHVAAVSSLLADHAAGGLGLPREEITVIPNGVDTNRFRFQDRSPADEVVVCVLGRLIPGKGPLQALEAFACLKRELPAAKLWFVGDGPMREELAAKAATYGLGEAVTFWGMLEKPEERLQKATVLWMPSRSEGLPVACIESMSSGVPVLGYDVRGVRGLLRDGCGILITPRDAGGLAEQTALLVQDDARYREIARAARSRVEKRYSLKQMCADHYALMRSLSGSRSTVPTVEEAEAVEIRVAGGRRG